MTGDGTTRSRPGIGRKLERSTFLEGMRHAKRTAPYPVAVLLALTSVVVSAWVRSALLYGPLSIGGKPPLIEGSRILWW